MYVILAILVIGFLIFIHELGHYFMARRVGMRVEAFGIGFGKPIYKWMRDGVEWRLNWLPFGGYVKIKGMDGESDKDPYDVEDGFFGKPPWDRIKVSLAGPLTNIVFALFAFALLWVFGGRVKTYGELTHRLGWLDSQSKLYQEGVRSGDEILSYDGHRVTTAKDHLYAPMTGDEVLQVTGLHINYFTGQKTPFSLDVEVYSHPLAADKDLKTAGVLDSANYLIYSPEIDVGEEARLVKLLSEGSPLQETSIQAGDRLVWANGEVLFSQAQLSQLINDQKTLLTIQRGGKTLQRRVPRVLVQELRVNSSFREEIIDWQYEAGLGSRRINNLRIIPYNLTPQGVVEDSFSFIDPEDQSQAFPETTYSALEQALQPGDRIIAVDGKPITETHQLLTHIQEPAAVLIVLRPTEQEKKIATWTQADQEFSQEIDWKALQQLIAGVGEDQAATSVGNLYRLKTVVPKRHEDFATTSEGKALYSARVKESQQELENIEDPERRSYLSRILAEREQRLHLGPPYFQDREVAYNPGPFELFKNVLVEIWRTLTALVTGALSPKWITGPVGLIQVMQQNWAAGLSEGLFWIGTISLNLGFLNLLPIPVLDGGTICFSLWELITRKRIKTKTLEKVIIPFAVLLIMFFVFLTYNDVSRILRSLFG